MILKRELADSIRAESKKYTCREYAERLNVPWSNLRTYASKFKIKFKPEVDWPKLRKEVVKLYNAGYNKTEAAKRLDVSHAFVSTWWPEPTKKKKAHLVKHNPFEGVDFSAHEVKETRRQALPTRFSAPETQTTMGNGIAMCAGV